MSINTEVSCVSLPDGWTYDTSYRFAITHLPDCGIIRLKLYEGAKLLHESGDIVDNGPESLRGGRLGVYCDSQESITWSALGYKYVHIITSVACSASIMLSPGTLLIGFEMRFL